MGFYDLGADLGHSEDEFRRRFRRRTRRLARDKVPQALRSAGILTGAQRPLDYYDRLSQTIAGYER
jgi:hypothetical protein